ncbi:hypothetical protein I7I50_10544 [Histoplasma capsulatum G186AR]|uniref:Uncharacterized protein n=1 Tax=Ajellomyces capsulatus TaxID=5037 RepID=A0A8H7Z8G3_AJECA|nr:hypothetical protein I7I52_01783 [Histoplasma capsulatum]QSS69298.1 hypothetical protein I7I50_10544 [Histoplasma capsulatum G186AR]
MHQKMISQVSSYDMALPRVSNRRKDIRESSSNQEIHIHILNDLLPIPAFLNTMVHDSPNFLNNTKGRFYIPQA